MTNALFATAGRWFQELCEAAPDPIWIIEDHRFVDCNPAAVAALGYASKSELLLKHPRDLSPPFQPCGEASAIKAERMIQLAEAQGSHRFDWVHLRADGSAFIAEVSLTALTVRGRKILYCSWRDLADRNRMEQALRESEQRFRDFASASADWMWEVDVSGRFTYVAGKVEAVLGYTASELVGRRPFDIMPPAEAARMRGLMKEITTQRRRFSDIHNINMHKSGRLLHFITSGVPVFDAAGTFIGYRGIDRDITALHERDEEILRLAYYDALTGLPNRTLLQDRVTQVLAADRRNGLRTALLFLDLDRFKVINDSLGHDVGDRLLIAMAERIRSVLREGDTLARLGGDEFVILLGGIKKPQHVAGVAEKIIAEVARPVTLQG